MIENISIKKNIVKYNPETLNKDIAEILSSRFNKKDFEEKSLADLHDPYLFKDMEKVIKRIEKAKENKEKVFIF
jgi:single-stranded-DNA-specific exonuclease